MRKNPEDFVAHWYKAYESLLNPVQGTKFWDLQQEGSVLSPHSIRKPMWRPKHARRRDPSEGPRNQFKASRQGVQGRCTHCESNEHTWRKYPTAPPRQQATQESQGTRVDEGPSQVRKKGRSKENLNKIRCGDMPPSNAPTPAFIILGRRSKAPTTSVEAGRGRGGGGRGRERGRGRGGAGQLRMPEGFGLW
ncbi:uncharacterized protein LOC109835524 [Asparagus officinalis]|uniref:uncharacterized protein LOC109835524 n=1 Tax=Asparagus officinalis TaxID=4686 RepID=UPI00098E85B4|nr:uncharacterized protein LOC109835524 [Asparagus officinalis]